MRLPWVCLVLLDNGLLAVFKNRRSDRSRIFTDVLVFEVAFGLLGLMHTVPPSVVKRHNGMRGVLQYYIPAKSVHDIGPYEVIKDISRDSYADMQVLRYVMAFYNRRRDSMH